MEKILYILFVLVCSSRISMAQGQLDIGGKKTDECWGITANKDGGYTMTGSTYSFADTVNGDVYVVRLDNTGKIKWTKVIGGKYWDVAYAIAQTYDMGYVITGETTSFGDTAGGDVYVIRLDSNGNIKWTETFGGRYNDYGQAIIQTKDKGYAIAGFTESFGDTVYGNGLVVKLDSTGAIQWAKEIGGHNGENFNAIVQTSDKGYAITGYTFSYGDTLRGSTYIIKLDSAGNLLWTRLEGGAQSENGAAIIETHDGGLAICGATTSFGVDDDFFLVKLNSLGNILWGSAIGGNGIDAPSALVQTNDGGYVMGGYSYSFADKANGDGYIVKLDSTGSKIVWTTSVGGTGTEYLNTMVQTPDGGFACGGITYSYNDKNNGDMYLVKLDSLGYTCDTVQTGGNLSVITGEDQGTGGYIASVSVNRSSYDSGRITKGGVCNDICGVITVNKQIPVQINQVNIYPNPSNGVFTIESSVVSHKLLVEIYNVLGEKVFSQYSIPTTQYQIDLSSQPGGMYFYRLLTENGNIVASGKLIKE
jgi:hypothetical protein